VSAARLLLTFALWGVLGALAATLLLVTVPRVIGVTPFTILTGSMEPGYAVGDVVLDERIAPLDARPGDVVTFEDPSRGGDLVTHRVERIRTDGSKVSFVTRGDANTASERWTVAASGSIGRVRMHVPKVGYVLQWARGREGKLALIAIPAALLALIELAGVARPRRMEATA
jgi:signal peptidase